jgi:uncharacterized protein (TIRG00374 family)
MNARFARAMKYLLSLGLLAWLLTRADVRQVAALMAGADPWTLLLALGAYLASVVVVAYRWRVLLVARKVPISLGRATALYFIGNFFSNFLPTSIGGDAVRAYSAGVDTGSRIDAFASVFIERFVGLFAIVILALLGFFLIALHLEHTYIVPATGILFAGMLGMFPVLFSRWWVDRLKRLFHRVTVFDIGRRAARLHEILYRYGENRGALGGNFLLSILYQGLIVVMNIFAAQALHIPVPPVYFVVFVPAIGIISMFPFSINALGFREGGYIFLFDRIGHSSSEALALSLTLYGITVVSSLPGGALFALEGGQRRRAATHPPSPMSVLTEDAPRERTGP